MTADVHASGSPTAATDELRSVLHDYMEVTRRLQQTHETLQHEVVRLRKELESKDRELERRRRLALLGELAAGVAHEVRNPLGAIQLYNGLLRAQVGQLRPALELIEKIDAGIRAIDAVVQDTLALAPRPDRRMRRPLGAILADAHSVCRPTLEARGIRFELRGAAECGMVAGDAPALQRVFVNLIVNAAEAAPPGSRVTVIAEPGPEEGLVRVRVLDEGPGLPEAIIDRIFDPFFTTKEHGTGLGLTIAHRLVEAHGGTLTAHNRPEGGAEFVVTLPTPGSADEEPAPADAAGQPHAA